MFARLRASSLRPSAIGRSTLRWAKVGSCGSRRCASRNARQAAGNSSRSARTDASRCRARLRSSRSGVVFRRSISASRSPARSGWAQVFISRLAACATSPSSLAGSAKSGSSRRTSSSWRPSPNQRSAILHRTGGGAPRTTSSSRRSDGSCSITRISMSSGARSSGGVSTAPQHCLYLRPEPQGQGALRSGRGILRGSPARAGRSPARGCAG